MSPKYSKILERCTAQKMKFSIKDFFSKCDVTFTEEVLNGKLHFCVVLIMVKRRVR